MIVVPFFLTFLVFLSVSQGFNTHLEAISYDDGAPYCITKSLLPQDPAERRVFLIERKVQRCKIDLKDSKSRATAIYEMNSQDVPLIRSVHAQIYPSSLSFGTSSGIASNAYANSMNDVFNGKPMENIVAGMAIGQILGGDGQNIANIFPQNPNVKNGEWAILENRVYTCLKANPTCVAHLFQRYHYDNIMYSRPFSIDYYTNFVCSSGSGCDVVEASLRN